MVDALLNGCHNRHLQCINRTMLSALSAARRATREEGNFDAKVTQMHKDGAAPRVCVDLLILDSNLYLLFMYLVG